MKHTKSTRGVGPKGKTLNHEGADAFVLDDESTLLNLVSTCMMNEPKFYGEQGEVEQQIFELAHKVDPQFLLQLAAYTRNELYMRSVSTYLLAISAHRTESKQFVRTYTPKIILRADELYETIACYLNAFGKPLPNSLKKGVADTFPNFDEYQFAKYSRKTDVTFKDVIMLSHAKQPSELIKKILNDTLETPETWEVEISRNGNKAKSWEKLIENKKLPYMATLRNLRNLLNADISDKHLDMVINYLQNEKAVRNSKQFPFRFFTAYIQLAGRGGGRRYRSRITPGTTHPRISEVLDALEEATYIAYENIPHMKGTTVIACDVSASMQQTVSDKSVLQLYDIGLLLGAATHKYTDRAITGFFGDSWKEIPLAKKSAGVIANTVKMHDREGEVGYSTNGYKVIQALNKNKTLVDRILIFTDCQMWDSDIRGSHFSRSRQDSTIRQEYEAYKRDTNPNVKLYLFNLNGYGTTNFPESDRSVVNINGWSDKILKFIETNEINPTAQVDYIKENY